MRLRNGWILGPTMGEEITAESWLMRDVWQTSNLKYGAKFGYRDPLKDQDGDEHSSLCLYIMEYLIVFELFDLTATQDSGEGEEKTEVLYGVENAVRTGVQFMQNARKWMELFGDKNGPSIIIEFADVYKNNYIGAKRRGAKIRFITEITKDNIHYCKELMEIVDEFRHLEGFTGGIAVSESEYQKR